MNGSCHGCYSKNIKFLIIVTDTLIRVTDSGPAKKKNTITLVIASLIDAAYNAYKMN